MPLNGPPGALPAASILIVAKGEPSVRLRETLLLCEAQTVRELEVLVAAPAVDRRQVEEAAVDVSVCVRFIDNETGARSAGLNLAAAAARSEILCRVDARTRPPEDYVERCIEALRDTSTGIYGGVQVPVSGADDAVARGIARALSNPYVLGAPAYRIGRSSGPSDTVYLGALRRTLWERLGGWNEALEANEDFDLAARTRTAGYVVYLDHRLLHSYECRTSVRSVLTQYFRFGRSKTVYWRRTRSWPNARQAFAIVVMPVSWIVWVLSRRRAYLLAGAALMAAAVDYIGGRHRQDDRRAKIVATCVGPMLPVAWISGVVWEFGRAVRWSMPKPTETRHSVFRTGSDSELE